MERTIQEKAERIMLRLYLELYTTIWVEELKKEY